LSGIPLLYSQGFPLYQPLRGKNPASPYGTKRLLTYST
jgi:hypothetical protein